MLNVINPVFKWKEGAIFTVNKPEYIIVHHALAKHCTVADIHAWHLANGWSGIGYHYFIDKKGNIYKGRQDTWNGAHTEEQNMNNRSIGICLEGCYEDYTDQTEKIVPQDQISSLELLVKDLMKRYNITIEHVKPHRFFATYKKCPGNYFPWDQFIKDLTPTPVVAPDPLADIRAAVQVLHNSEPVIISDVDGWIDRASKDNLIKCLINKMAFYIKTKEGNKNG